MTGIYFEEGEVLECHNHCDWRGTTAELENPAEDVYCCPKCGASMAMIMEARDEAQG